MRKSGRDALVGVLSAYDRLVEVGVGREPAVAAALADRGRAVVTTDVYAFPVPEGVRFVRDDVVEASERDHPGEHYRADCLYARNLPPELHRPLRDVARAVDADCLFTTLGYDEPAIPTSREPLEGSRETLFVVRR
ncbi:UPF0146 family protein [Halobium salinum]|uniref:UPF0146 protein ACFO0N_08940 n=1 Tax=Halobium salinum TaxID=1364940 RepID=A0ABD5PC71_9EURY|nr:UPF0146 family protein [Halobium salinum]